MANAMKRQFGCDSKVRYLDVSKAIAAADRYMNRITLTAAPMQPYYCRDHDCWHIGHDRTKVSNRTDKYQVECVNRHRIRHQIQVLNDALIGIEAELVNAA